MELSGTTKIDELLKEYPFLLDFMVNRSPKYKILQSSVMRRTVGKVAPLAHVAAIGGIELATLLAEIAAEIRAKTGDEVTIAPEGSAPLDAAARQEILKGIIRDLHDGVDMAILKQRFHDLVSDIEATEIARLEQQLIAEGMPESEIKRLCDVHVEVFKESLGAQEPPAAPAGHPVHTYMKENRIAEGLVAQIKARLEKLCETPEKEHFRPHRGELLALLDSLAAVNLHYLRKENQLFPVLELHDITGPTEVMWSIHDDIRQTLKYAREQVAELQVPLVYGTLALLLRSVTDMIYKEERILFPMALEILTEADWAKVRAGEEEIGYAWVEPDAGWAPEGGVAVSAGAAFATGEIPLDTGRLSPEVVNLLLTHLPVDLSFVNEHDEVVYYSQTRERIFPRSPGVIGRKVQKCHPPKSLHVVQRMLDEFRAGTKENAEFWIRMQGRFIHIRYFAVRDAQGSYRGTLEVSQDVTEIRKLEGEQRLLDWD